MSAQETYWFRPKRYGYGAEPANWRGWAATGVYIAATLAVAWFGIASPAVSGEEANTILPWAALIAMTVAFVWLCRVKCDGVWRWRRGDSE